MLLEGTNWFMSVGEPAYYFHRYQTLSRLQKDNEWRYFVPGLASPSYDHQDDNDDDDDDDDGPACWLWLSKQVGHKHFEISISSQISPQSSPHSNDTGAVYSGKSDFSKVRESYRLNIKAKNCICWTSPQHSLHSHDHCPRQSSVHDHFKASVFAYFVGHHIVMADLGTKRFSNFGQRHVIVGI